MPQALSSFLLSVSIIIAISLFVPCIQSIARLVRRHAQGAASIAQAEAAKVFSRETA